MQGNVLSGHTADGLASPTGRLECRISSKMSILINSTNIPFHVVSESNVRRIVAVQQSQATTVRLHSLYLLLRKAGYEDQIYAGIRVQTARILVGHQETSPSR